MDALQNMANQFRDIANTLETAVNEINDLNARCEWLMNENSKNEELKRKMIDLLQNNLY